MVNNKEQYLQKAQNLFNAQSFIGLVTNYPDNFFDRGYWRYFVRLKNRKEFLNLIKEYKKENKDFRHIKKLDELKADELSNIILWAFNRDEAKIKEKERLEDLVDETVKNIKKAPRLYVARQKNPENRSPGYAIFSKE
mgnify:CR=1 FL=1